MENVTYKMQDNTLVFAFNGKISSENAAAVEEKVNEIIKAQAHEKVVVDAENLEYISSAGLRVILRLKKAEPSLKVINVSADVYEIFDMTGFTEIITIEKAYRKLSVEGCEAIGKGANGTVYRLDPDTIIKVYHNADALADIHR